MEYLIGPRYLAANHVHIIGGGSSVGKTTFLFQAINHFRKELFPLVYLIDDRPKEGTVAKFAELGIEPWPVEGLIDRKVGTSDEECRRVGRDPEHAYVWMTTSVKRWQEESATKLRTIVLDPAIAFLPCRRVNDYKEVAGACATLSAWALRERVTVMLVWHSNKTKVDELNDIFDAISGSTGIQGYTATKIMLVRGPRGKRNAYVRGPKFGDFVIELQMNDEGVFSLLGVQPVEAHEAAADIELMQWISDDPGGTHWNDICEAAGLSRAGVMRKRANLVGLGYLARVRGRPGFYCTVRSS